MKKTAIALMLAMTMVPVTAFADAAADYKAKCQMCHGADGKKSAKADLTKLDKPEADLVKFLTSDAKHKTKVADEASAKALVAFLKTLK